MNLANLDRLITARAQAPDASFNMNSYIVSDEGKDDSGLAQALVEHTCGTVACIAGWCSALAIQEGNEDSYLGSWPASRWLDIDLDQDDNRFLFFPPGFSAERLRAETNSELYPRTRALAMLRHMRDTYATTGEVVVDWDADRRTPA